MIFRVRVYEKWPEEAPLLAECYTTAKDYDEILPMGGFGPLDNLSRFRLDVVSQKQAETQYDDDEPCEPFENTTLLGGNLVQLANVVDYVTELLPARLKRAVFNKSL